VPGSSVSMAGYVCQRIANALAGVETPPGTLRGAEVTRQNHRSSAAEASGCGRKFHSSPMAKPSNASSSWCIMPASLAVAKDEWDTGGMREGEAGRRH